MTKNTEIMFLQAVDEFLNSDSLKRCSFLWQFAPSFLEQSEYQCLKSLFSCLMTSWNVCDCLVTWNIIDLVFNLFCSIAHSLDWLTLPY